MALPDGTATAPTDRWADMGEVTGRLTTRDGLGLFHRSWVPAGEVRAVVAILHGGGEHGGRYTHVAERLVACGFRVDALDQRSHGHSERVRGVPLQCEQFEDLVDDAAEWLAIRRDPARPLFVIGHSMGGLVAVTLAAHGRLEVRGLITLGAALRLTPPAILERAAAEAARDPDGIVVPMSRSGFDASSRDEAMTAAIRADPTHADVVGVPAQFLASVAAHCVELDAQLERVNVPLLAMHGTADLMADPNATVELVERASSTDKTLHLVDDGYHALLCDLDRDQTLDTIMRWIEQRL